MQKTQSYFGALALMANYTHNLENQNSLKKNNNTDFLA